MDGILLINKPTGISSFDCIRRLRAQTGQRKIGHAGTLDPAASGLMIMLFGKACKDASNYSKLDKTYFGEVTLGASSSTDDAEGELAPISDRKPGIDELQSALANLTGQIMQTPPAYSAIKVEGQRAYSLARAGRPPKLAARPAIVYELNLISYAYPKVNIEAKVSSGTYIRALARDLGANLGVGGHLSGLQRISIGRYRLEDAIDLDQADLASVQARLQAI